MIESLYLKKSLSLKNLFCAVFAFLSIIYFLFSNYLPNAINIFLGLIIVSFIFYFLIERDKNIFIFLSMPILLISSSFEPIKGISFLNFFDSGIFSYVSLYHLFGFMCLLNVIIIFPFLKRKFILDSDFIILLILVIVASISIIKAFQQDSERLFQALFFVQNIAVTLYFYEWLSKWDTKKLNTLISAIFILSIGIIFFHIFTFGNQNITHSKFFFLAASIPLIVYVSKYNKLYLPFIFLIIFTLLWFTYSSGIQHGSATTKFIIMFSVISTLTYYVSRKLFSLFIFFSLSIFLIINLSFLIFSIFPDFIIQNLQLTYDERFQVEDGFLERIRFKLFADRSAIWMGVFNNLSEYNFMQNFIKYSGEGFYPLYHGTFSSEERAYTYWTAGAHQLTLELIMNLGIFGCLVFLIFFIKKLILINQIAMNTTNDILILLYISTISYFIFPSLVSNFVLQSYSFLFWLSLGILLAYNQFNNKKI